jgi:diguanylate cyclase (GGDEF)-like protein
MRNALEAGTSAAVLWQGVRDDAGELVDLRIVECTQGFADWVHQPRDSLPGALYTAIIPSGIHERLQVYLGALRDRRPGQLDFKPVPLPGRADAAQVRVVPCGDDLLYSQVWDSSERERLIQEANSTLYSVEADLHRMEQAWNAVPHGISLCQAERDDEGSIRDIRTPFVNDAAARAAGRASESWNGARLLDWIPSAKYAGLWERLVVGFNSHLAQTFSLPSGSLPGWAGDCEYHIAPFGSDYALLMWQPVAAPSSAGVEASASGLSHYDNLTGALTHAAFCERLESVLRSADADTAIILLLDLDDFGQVNDLIGRHRADQVLAEFAAGLRMHDPRPKLLARTGPDEFALLLEGPLSAEEMSDYLVRVELHLAQLAKSAGVPRLHVSGGYERVDRSLTPSEMLQDCATAMRTCILTGGATVAEYTPALRERLLRQSRLSGDILSAIHDRQFAIAYQPIIRIQQGGTHWGDEALLRWCHGTYGVLAPAHFIPAAEASGVIVELGSWVIEKTIADLSGTSSRTHATVNVSGRQFLDSDVPSSIANHLEAHAVPARRLFVEITESALLPDSMRVRGQLAELRSMGVRVALDDFGSGYSSIAYLDRLPVDIVKLDGYFLDGELTARRRRLIESTAAMVRSLGAKALVEHIETAEQLDIVRDAGVDLGQGYLFGRPAFADVEA